MIKEYDIVESLYDLSDKVLKGYRGTVLIVYSDFPNAYEVEFVSDTSVTIDVLTVKADDIKLMSC
jgi:hypothetical protein